MASLPARLRSQAQIVTLNSPDFILIQGAVRTMDPALPVAEALAICGDRLVAVGSNREIKALAGPLTKIFDARQGTVLPGFNDAHVHFMAGGFSLSNVNLRDAISPEDLARRLAKHVESKPKGQWILGGDWDHENWQKETHSARVATLPTVVTIDAVTPEHPVLITRLDGHMALANSLALKLAGVGRDTPNPPGGIIVRDPKAGLPTGLLKEAAQGLVERVIPPRSFTERREAARTASQYAARHGVTSVTDVSADNDVGLYQDLLNRGELRTRIYAGRPIVSWENEREGPLRSGPRNNMLKVGVLKGFCDGSLGSSTARFFEPYDDAPENRGLLLDQMLPEGIMRKRVQAADRCGFQIMIHAIGDEANCQILDLYQEVARANGPRDRRFRIEHAQHLRESEIPRFARQQVIASMQPYHAADDGRWCEQRIGGTRSKGAYVFRSLLDAGAVLAFGSDWTVAPLNPLLGIKAAVTRQTLDGQYPQGWNPEQKITLDEAIRGFTCGSAYAEFAESSKGTLSPDKLADLVVLDRDLYRGEPAQLDEARVVLTMLGGKVIFEG
jgi:hypothetical protein